MKTRRNLLRAALLSFALTVAFAAGQVGATTPASLDQCGPEVWSCNVAANCADYCFYLVTGSTHAACNRFGCCVCLAP